MPGFFSRAIFNKPLDAPAADSRAAELSAADGPPCRIGFPELVLVDAANGVTVVDRTRLAASPTLLDDPLLFL